MLNSFLTSSHPVSAMTHSIEKANTICIVFGYTLITEEGTKYLHH